MIVTERFVFLHLHKSGGSFVNDCLLRFVPDARQIGYHLPRSLLPPGAAQLPVLGLVRNPWSYYVSWYSFQKRRPQPNALFRVLSDDGRLDFEPTLRRMLSLSEDGALRDRLVAALPTQYLQRGLNLPGFALAPIAGSGLGFYSYLYRYLYAGTGLRHIGRMERLRTDLVPMLVSVGQGVSGAMRQFIEASPARNVSEHAAYVDYYTPALAERVAVADATVIRAHGYCFGDPPINVSPVPAGDPRLPGAGAAGA